MFARPAFSFIFAKVSRNTLKIHLNRKKVHLLLLSLSTLKKLKNEPICPLGSRIKKEGGKQEAKSAYSISATENQQRSTRAAKENTFEEITAKGKVLYELGLDTDQD